MTTTSRPQPLLEAFNGNLVRILLLTLVAHQMGIAGLLAGITIAIVVTLWETRR